MEKNIKALNLQNVPLSALQLLHGIFFFVLLLCVHSNFFLYFFGFKLSLLSFIVVPLLGITFLFNYQYIIAFVEANKYILVYLLVGLFINLNQAIVAFIKLFVMFLLFSNTKTTVLKTIRSFVLFVSWACIITFIWQFFNLPTKVIEIVDGEHSTIFSQFRYLYVTPFGAYERLLYTFTRVYGFFGEPSEAVFFFFPFLYHYFKQKDFFVVACVFLAMLFTGSTSLIFLFILIIIVLLQSDLSFKYKVLIQVFALFAFISILILFSDIFVSRLFSSGKGSEFQVSRYVYLVEFFANKGVVKSAEFAAPNSLILFVFRVPFLLIFLLLDLKNRFKKLPQGYSRTIFATVILAQSFITQSYYESLPYYFLSTNTNEVNLND